MTSIAIALHVGAGAVWLLSSLAIAVTGRGARWLLALQMGAALIAVGAGIHLWHALHAGRQGPTEHWLILGTVAAFIGFGLQIGISGPALFGTGGARLEGGGLVLARVGALFLALAAAAMVASLYR